MDPSLLQDKKSTFPATFLVGAVIIVLLVGGVILLTRGHGSGAAAEPPLPMGPAEQAYTANIHFSDLHMTRASNMLNQELTYLNGVLSNDGPRAIRRMEITIEFHNQLRQVILRETRRIPGAYAAPLAPGEHREFEFIFEHIPVEWEQTHEYPTLTITGLQLN